MLSEVNNYDENVIDKNCIASLFGVLVKKIDLSIIYRSQSRGQAFPCSLHRRLKNMQHRAESISGVPPNEINHNWQIMFKK